MDWISFLTGAIGITFAWALFKGHDGDELEDDEDQDETEEFTGRHVTLSCQTCRKLKKHREVELNLYQCTKCKRHVDLR